MYAPHGPDDSPEQVTVVTTYLEMFQPPAALPPEAPPDSRVEQVYEPLVSFYRYLYDTVGGPWLWIDRRRMSDEALDAIIRDPGVEIYLLSVRGQPAGFCELDCRNPTEVELAYFGLIPEFIGRGLGPYLLRYAIDRAWRTQPGRVWVHTCSLDHPKALETYRRAGFAIYHTESASEEKPTPAT
ncbi:MAG: GNAT family N-acetyltransferase [Verrucomicrobia bacterium]|nr:GNAT family N-acetyltransferase [Verrucomicrobiota bacterium]